MTTSHEEGPDAAQTGKAQQDASGARERPSEDDQDDVDEYADPELETPRATY
jgi:hypothetical protein